MIEIPADVVGEILSHADGEFPIEACGLLAGSIDGSNGAVRARVERFYPARNADASAGTYRLDSKEQFTLFSEIEEKGWDLVGIYHSHTHSEAYPSETDRRQAGYPDAHYLLVSLEDRDNPVVRAFTIVDGEIEEQDVTVA
jgi:[CysO sulfur-carrier protein]-S-L-cysteine hydrolase